MSPQRKSGYVRQPNEAYNTPPWLAATIAPYLRRAQVTTIWEPAGGVDSSLAVALVNENFEVIGTDDDFLERTCPPTQIDCVCTNPPYGDRGELACAFIRHALSLEVRIVVMLLRIDFDSAKSRVDIFRDSKTFAGKIVLLDRIKCFEGPRTPSDNHCWCLWNREHRGGEPRLAYAARAKEVA
jgi:hypothetical protein